MPSINELKPIIDLINHTEERLAAKIDEAHSDIKKQNGRLRETEITVAKIDTKCKARGESCKSKIDKIRPAVKVNSFFMAISKRPVLYALLFLGVLVGVQTLVLEATQNDWIKELFNLISKI